jgi:hypothetical protein
MVRVTVTVATTGAARVNADEGATGDTRLALTGEGIPIHPVRAR